jgi:REP element-mobilizing transposase RayT
VRPPNISAVYFAVQELISIFVNRMTTSAYRPRNPGHDYYGRGTYLITLVVSEREQLLSSFTAVGIDALKEGNALTLTPLGEVVEQAWQRIPEAQSVHGNRVLVLSCVCMPDHFHGVIEVLEPMEWSLGDIIQAFKASCTSQWQRLMGMEASVNRPISVDLNGPKVPGWLREKALRHDNEGALIRSMSKKQRQEYYALVGRNQQPLFDDNYDDTVCLDERHRQAMIAYVHDNPRRALLRRLLPDVMRRCLHVRIGNRSYGAFGNLFLLRWARKIQVQCHRKHPVTGQPYEETADYASERQQWERAILEGCTVIVTPGISGGERLMKNECLQQGFPLIHLQKEPIGAFWKPERQRFEACANGSLLILAPWDLDAMGSVGSVPADSEYSRFHNLNTLAAEICAFDGAARIVG